MDHRQYVERYLGLYADDEVSAEERLEISDHVASCKDCEVLLAAECATRAILRQNVPEIPAPDALRHRILASLDAVDRAEARMTRVRRFNRRPFWIAAASFAACVAVIIFNLRTHSVENPAFDAAVASFVDSERKFVPTVGAGSTDELAVAMINQFGVPLVWDFSSIGLSSRGGRIDKMPDGKDVAYSLYKGSKGSLLCIINRGEGFRFFPGDQVVKGIHLYRYKGYSIAATNRYSVLCVMVSDLSVADLARAFDRLPS
jgi:hypothetical protein